MPKTKRAYEPAESSDGTRFLVDRSWPRGIKKEKLEMNAWLKKVSPSPALRGNHECCQSFRGSKNQKTDRMALTV